MAAIAEATTQSQLSQLRRAVARRFVQEVGRENLKKSETSTANLCFLVILGGVGLQDPGNRLSGVACWVGISTTE